MFAYINNAQILGNVTKDAELRYTAGGFAVLNFTVATNHSKKTDDGYEDYAIYHNVTFLGNLAEKAAPRIKKGVMIYVQGMIKNDSWQDDQGNWKNRSEITTSDFRNVRILDRQGGAANAADESSATSTASNAKPKKTASKKSAKPSEEIANDDPFADDVDDLPF